MFAASKCLCMIFDFDKTAGILSIASIRDVPIMHRKVSNWVYMSLSLSLLLIISWLIRALYPLNDLSIREIDPWIVETELFIPSSIHLYPLSFPVFGVRHLLSLKWPFCSLLIAGSGGVDWLMGTRSKGVGLTHVRGELSKLEKRQPERLARSNAYRCGRKASALLPSRLVWTSALAPRWKGLVTESSFQRLYIVRPHTVVEVPGREPMRCSLCFGCWRSDRDLHQEGLPKGLAAHLDDRHDLISVGQDLDEWAAWERVDNPPSIEGDHHPHQLWKVLPGKGEIRSRIRYQQKDSQFTHVLSL